MNDAVRRAIRTLIILIVAAVPGIPAVAQLWGIPAGRVTQVVGSLTFLVTILTAAVNHAEDKGAIPAFLKAPPSPGADPIPAPTDTRTTPVTGIVIINKSTMASNIDVQEAAAACSLQIAQHVAPSWGRVPMPVTFGSSAAPGCLPIFVFDHAVQAGALGFHDETPDGRQYGKAFVADCQKAGVSLSSVISHEVCEAFIDPACNLWADTGKHTAIALEVGDPVEDGSYTVNLNGRLIEVSNFVLPAWFDPRHHGGKVDWLGQLSAPFTRTAGGYVIVEKEGAVTEQFGKAYSRSRRAAKKNPASRTARRVASGR